MDIAKKEKDKHLGLRIDTELHYKLHYISQYEGRSANGEVIYLIRKDDSRCAWRRCWRHHRSDGR